MRPNVRARIWVAALAVAVRRGRVSGEKRDVSRGLVRVIGTVFALALVALAPSAHAERHVVQRGETLEHVAAGHGCSVEAVQRANHLATSLVRPGTTLDIPACSITSRARARALHATSATVTDTSPDTSKAHRALASAKVMDTDPDTHKVHGALAFSTVTATSPDTDKARRALAVIDGATWIDAKPRALPDNAQPTAGGRDRDRVASDDESAASHSRASESAITNPWSVPASIAMPSDHTASIGAPWSGRLEHAAHLDPGDGYDVRRPSRAFGADHVVAHLRHVIAEVRALYPDVHTLAIGDLSAEHGGHISEHRSHQSGLDVDVGFYFRRVPDGYPSQFAAADANLDIEATWALLMAFARTADRDDGVAMIFLDYDVQRRLYEWAKRRGTPDAELEFLFQYPRGADTLAGLVRHWPAHANHFHVRFKP